MNYEELLNKLKNNQGFSFSRWGDGEWACLLGKHGENCDGHKYFNTLGFRLTSILQEKPKYYLGLQEKAVQSSLGPQIDRYFDFWQLRKLNWDDADIIHKASMHNKLDEFIEQMKGENCILIANADVCKWYGMVNPIGMWFVIPDKNAWCAYEYIKHQLLIHMMPGLKIYYCMGMATNVIVDDMYNIFGDTITQVDCGSVFDPYAGNNTRRYHAGLKI